MAEILIGAIVMASFVIGLFFLRFWKNTGDRFFLFFSMSFWIDGINRALVVMLVSWDQSSTQYYLFRILAYMLIVAGILYKNRRSARSKN
jgi:hypothetical protein